MTSSKDLWTEELYKTVWEIKQRIVLDVAADRGAYIDQPQSLNIHMIDATTAKLSSMGRIRIIEEEVEDEDADASAY